MTERKVSFEGTVGSGEKVLPAIIMGPHPKKDHIIIKCPRDIQEFVVHKDTKEFICPIDKTILILP